MKSLLTIILLTLSGYASAEFCSTAIVDQYSQYQYQQFTRSSYSHDDACYLAMTDCRRALSDGQSQGRYRTAACQFINSNPVPTPPPQQSVLCETDLLDYYGNVVRQFTAPGTNSYDACRQSDEFCKMELARRTSYGMSCVNRGLINGRNPSPRPRPDIIVETCQASRLDPAGMFVEGYTGRAEGPRGTDVKGEACRDAYAQCSRELVGRQTCNINR
jgi:hypothetical protein